MFKQAFDCAISFELSDSNGEIQWYEAYAASMAVVLGKLMLSP